MSVKVRARVECCRHGCEVSYEYWADLSANIVPTHSSYGEGEPEAEIQLSPPGDAWSHDGKNIYGGDEYVCPDCASSDRMKGKRP
jgi:hypothetical protein